MEIILSKNIDKLGRVGDVVKVKDGFARNYLFPQNLGIAATSGNIKKVAQLKAKEAALYEVRKKEAQALAELHREAHEECFIANSVRTDIVCVPVA